MKKIIVTNAGRGAGINFCRSLRLADESYEIIALDNNKYSLMNAEADKKYLSPLSTETYYIDFLKEIIFETKADFLYPSKTNEELWLISKHRQELNIKTFLPPDEMIQIYEDKFQVYKCLKRAGIKVPDTILLNNSKQLEEFMKIHKKVWLRAIKGCGGNGSISTDCLELGTNWINNFDGWGSFTAAQVLTPRTATWSGIWKNGDLIVSQIRERKYWEFSYLSVSGVTGITGGQVTKRDEYMDELAIRCIKAVEPYPHGIVSVDFCYDEESIPNPTEIQASRFYTSSYFMAKAGLNLPHIMIQAAFDEKVERFPTKYSPLPEDLLWIKYVDCEPLLTTVEEVNKSVERYEQRVAECGWNK